MTRTKQRPEIVVIGGGVVGASIAYQLARQGEQVLVLERALLGSGSTSRAAGLLGQLRSTEAATRMLMESLEIVTSLERELDSEIFVKTGSLRLATTPERVHETEEHVRFGQSLGLDIRLLAPDELRSKLPYARHDDVLAASYCPTDGHLMPHELHDAFVRLARRHGAEFRPHAPVDDILVENGRVRGVRCQGQRIEADRVVNAAGPWSYLIAECVGSTLQTSAIGHTYLTTMPVADIAIERESPAVRDYDHRIYSRPEAGGLLVGIYEATPEIYHMEKLRDDFDMSALRVARDNLSVALLREAAGHRFPFLNGRVRFQVTQGIMTFTPNGSPLCGELPDIAGLFHCSGFCGHGIVRSPAIGAIVADLVRTGQTHYDMAQLRADRYFDLPGYQDREDIITHGTASYAGHYGKMDPELN